MQISPSAGSLFHEKSQPEGDNDRRVRPKAGQRLRPGMIQEGWIRANERAAVGAERQAVRRARPRTPELQGVWNAIDWPAGAPLSSALAPLVVPGCALKTNPYEFGNAMGGW
jgi:hypothetical protein